MWRMIVSRIAAAVPFGIGLVAVAGLVHITAVLLYPVWATADAFARVSALAPVGEKIGLKPGTPDLPGRDAAMAGVVCRYDLSHGPFRIRVTAFDDGFLSFGMHSRSGMAFYGLNLHAGDDKGLTMVLTGVENKAVADQAASGEDSAPDLTIAAPEPEGFVVIDAPVGVANGAQALLDHVGCGAAAMRPTISGS